MDPLKCTELYESKPLKSERFFSKIPILGWMLSGAFYHDRINPYYKTILKQLKARNSFPESEWKNTNIDMVEVKKICKGIKLNQFWPNDYFHPLDPMYILLYEYKIGMDLIHFVVWLEKQYNLKFNDNEISNALSRMTLKDFIEYLLKNYKHL